MPYPIAGSRETCRSVTINKPTNLHYHLNDLLRHSFSFQERGERVRIGSVMYYWPTSSWKCPTINLISLYITQQAYRKFVNIGQRPCLCTRHHHKWCRARKFLKFQVSRSLETAYFEYDKLRKLIEVCQFYHTPRSPRHCEFD